MAKIPGRCLACHLAPVLLVTCRIPQFLIARLTSVNRCETWVQHIVVVCSPFSVCVSCSVYLGPSMVTYWLSFAGSGSGFLRVASSKTISCAFSTLSAGLLILLERLIPPLMFAFPVPAQLLFPRLFWPPVPSVLLVSRVSLPVPSPSLLVRSRILHHTFENMHIVAN